MSATSDDPDPGLYLIGISISDEDDPVLYFLYFCDSEILENDTPVLDQEGRIVVFSDPRLVNRAFSAADPFYKVVASPPTEMHSVISLQGGLRGLTADCSSDDLDKLLNLVNTLLDCVRAIKLDLDIVNVMSLISMQVFSSLHLGKDEVFVDLTSESARNAVYGGIGAFLSHSVWIR